jgi:hypothetical protein
MKHLAWVLLLVSHCGAGIAPPCSNETEVLYQVEGGLLILSPGMIRMYDSTDHENYGKEESNFFNIFVESDNGIWQGCLPKDACFMAEIDEDATDADAITFQQNGNVIETNFTFPGYSGSKIRTFVELGECLPVCDATLNLYSSLIYMLGVP